MSTPAREGAAALKEKAAAVAIRREIRTASLASSIWQPPLDEPAFRQTVVDLALTTSEVPWEADVGLPPAAGAPQLVEIAASPTADEQTSEHYHLSHEDEHRLANDFALIAATKEAVFSVTAACVQEQNDSHGNLVGLKLVLAANEGVSKELQNDLQQIWNCLADRSAGRRSLAERIFKKIIHLNRVRLLQRVRKAVGHPPIFREKGRTRTNPDDRLQRALLRMQKQKLSEVGHRFIQQGLQVNDSLLSFLDDVPIKQAESGCEAVLAKIGNLVKECFQLTTDGGRIPFKHMLSECGLDARFWLKSKYIGEVDKIGSYWRIAMSLVQIYRKLEATLSSDTGISLSVQKIQPYTSVVQEISIQGRPMSCYVHAEIQLFTHYLQEEASVASRGNPIGATLRYRPPRIIGASKSACFLCFLCLSCHGGLTPPATHGRLYDQWTIPDMAEYTPDQAGKLRQTLQLMQDVMTRLRREYSLKRPRDHPMTSRADIDRLSVFSDTSVFSVQSTPPGGALAEGQVPGGLCLEDHGNIADASVFDLEKVPSQLKQRESHEKVDRQDNLTARSFSCGMLGRFTALAKRLRPHLRSRTEQQQNR